MPIAQCPFTKYSFVCNYLWISWEQHLFKWNILLITNKNSQSNKCKSIFSKLSRKKNHNFLSSFLSSPTTQHVIELQVQKLWDLNQSQYFGAYILYACGRIQMENFQFSYEKCVSCQENATFPLTHLVFDMHFHRTDLVK